MSREAKIGMLTGLFVIVLIGVLLSEYLGNGGTPVQGTSMAPLTGLGEDFRRSTIEPTVNPGIIRASEPGLAIPAAFAAERTPVASAQPTLKPAPVGTNGTPSIPPLVADTSAPAAVPPVSAVPAGPVIDPTKGLVPTIELIDEKKTELVARLDETKADATPVRNTQSYVIAKGDTLDKLARKFYKVSSKENKQRIIAANPKLLKDETSVLMLGKTLAIPEAPAAVIETAKVPTETAKVELPTPGPVAKGGDAVVIHPPGMKIEPKKEVAKTAPTAGVYIVQKGDSLEKIARKSSSKDYRDVMKQIMAANGLKDPNSIKVGMKLKMPVKL